MAAYDTQPGADSDSTKRPARWSGRQADLEVDFRASPPPALALWLCGHRYAECARRAAAALQEGFAQAGRVFMTQAAMGWSFRGNVERVEDAVAGMSPDHLRQVSAAAALLGDAADQELGRRAG